jgi:hypothetical protein
MTPPPSHSRKRLPRSLHALLIVALLGIGCDLSAVPAWRACQLLMPFGWVIYLTPLLAVVAYAVIGLLLGRTRLGRAAWAVAYAIGALVVLRTMGRRREPVTSGCG